MSIFDGLSHVLSAPEIPPRQTPLPTLQHLTTVSREHLKCRHVYFEILCLMIQSLRFCFQHSKLVFVLLIVELFWRKPAHILSFRQAYNARRSYCHSLHPSWCRSCIFMLNCRNYCYRMAKTRRRKTSKKKRALEILVGMEPTIPSPQAANYTTVDVEGGYDESEEPTPSPRMAWGKCDLETLKGWLSGDPSVQRKPHRAFRKSMIK